MISGNLNPVVGKEEFYQLTNIFRNPFLDYYTRYVWAIWQKQKNGNWINITKDPPKMGQKVPFTFHEKVIGRNYRLEVYKSQKKLFSDDWEAEKLAEIFVTPKSAKIPKITKVELYYVDDTPGNKFSFMEKLRVKATCVYMFKKDIKFTLWEDDAQNSGHSTNNKPIATSTKKVNENGFAVAEFSLTQALMKKAMEGEADIKQLEFYATAEYYANNKHATENKNIDNPFPPPQTQTKAQTTPNQTQTTSTTIPQNQPQTQNPAPQTPPEPETSAEARGTIQRDQPPTQQQSSGVSPTLINEGEKTEGIVDAYFAKKEYTKQTGEEVGTLEYTFAKDGNKTADNAQKENIAKAILGKANVVALKDKKEYTTLESIKTALTANVYNKNNKITFKTFKLGAEFKKISSATLEDNVYLIAKTYALEGKQATIIIKEKDGVIKGSADAMLPILEITEEQMEQTGKAGEEVQGTEKTEFTGTVMEKEVRIPVHLRPKSDEDLKQWKEKLAKGKEDGTYTYAFGSQTSIPNGSGDEKKRIAAIILDNAKNGKKDNPKIEAGKTAFVADIENALTEETYLAGATISFKLFKKQEEFLYLQVKATGEKEHSKDFLKAEGAYFQIGNSKYIIFPLRVKPRNDINGPNKKDYWGENKTNQTTYGYDRDKGTRKHAARDLETESNEIVVAIADGIVLASQVFYEGTDEVTIHHIIPDGREFIIRYGELDPESILVKKGDKVTQNQELGKTGKMNGISRFMVHFEQYTGSEGFEVETKSLTDKSNPPFKRRKDLIDSLELLQEGYKNTFESGSKNKTNNGNRASPETLNFSQNGIDFLKGYETEIKKDGKHVYFNDGYGYCTIGYGHLIAGKNSCETITIPDDFKEGLTDEEANALLFQDVQRISNLVKSKVSVNLLQNEFDALVSLAFNVEASVGSESTLLRKLNSEDYEGAADEFKNWRLAGGVISPGLVTRRSQETEIFKNNIYDSTH